jgi:hypothetical protein
VQRPEVLPRPLSKRSAIHPLIVMDVMGPERDLREAARRVKSWLKRK